MYLILPERDGPNPHLGTSQCTFEYCSHAVKMIMRLGSVHVAVPVVTLGHTFQLGQLIVQPVFYSSRRIVTYILLY